MHHTGLYVHEDEERMDVVSTINTHTFSFLRIGVELQHYLENGKS